MTFGATNPIMISSFHEACADGQARFYQNWGKIEIDFSISDQGSLEENLRTATSLTRSSVFYYDLGYYSEG